MVSEKQRMQKKIELAKVMYKDGSTHGQVKAVTGLSHEVEYIVNDLGIPTDLILEKLDQIKEGMKSKELEELFKNANVSD